MTTTVTIYNRGPNDVWVVSKYWKTGTELCRICVQPQKGVDMYCYLDSVICVEEIHDPAIAEGATVTK